RRDRIAPTEVVDGAPLLGVVHDPTTRYMGGVAGHAGLFTTASDLARFAEMILNGGTWNGIRILSEGSVAKMTSPASPASRPDIRGLVGISIPVIRAIAESSSRWEASD